MSQWYHPDGNSENRLDTQLDKIQVILGGSILRIRD